MVFTDLVAGAIRYCYAPSQQYSRLLAAWQITACDTDSALSTDADCSAAGVLDFQPTGKSFKVSTSIGTLDRMRSNKATHATAR